MYMIHLFRGDTEKAEIAAERALEGARRAGYVRGVEEAVFFLVLSRLVGPTPADKALHDCEELLADSPGPMRPSRFCGDRPPCSTRSAKPPRLRCSTQCARSLWRSSAG